MSLITKEVEVSLNPKNISYFENLGYIIPKYKNNYREMIKRGTKLVIKIEDLQDGSNIIIESSCDICHEIRYIEYYEYILKMKNNNVDLCKECAKGRFAEKGRLGRLSNWKTFEQWCNETDNFYMLSLWDYSKNKHNPDNVSFTTGRIHYFKCPKGLHESKGASLANITRQNMEIICPGCNSVQYNYPDSIKVWSDKNKKTPLEVSQKNSKKFYWRCENNIHIDFSRSVLDSVTCGFRCPLCSSIRNESFLQEKVRLYLNSFGYTINHERGCYLICVNPKTNRKLPFDNEVLELGIICEIMGIQHYRNIGWNLKNKAKEENIQSFKEMQWRDEYKRQYALSQNYAYLAIPYTADDSSETYKDLIDRAIYDRIQELNNQ